MHHSLPGTMLLLFLLPAAFLLPPGARGGEIIEGKEARPHSRPYMAFVETARGPESVTSCGGFLVRADFVLTAAHCSEDGSGEAPTIVILGAHDLDQKEGTQQRIRVRDKIPHEDFDPETLENDIMLLRVCDLNHRQRREGWAPLLERRAERTSAVKPIPLPQDNFLLKPGAPCSVAGWGKTGVHRVRFPSKLREATLPVADGKQCQRFFDTFNQTSMLCVGNSKAKQSAFQGDSGGPLVCDNVAQGIVSHGKHSGLPPAVYTRIAAFLPWLRKKMGRE